MPALAIAAVGAEAEADFEDRLRRHRALRLDPGEEARPPRDVLAADFEDVFEPGRGQERRRRALSLKDEVGRDRGAVQHPRECRALDPGLGEDGTDPGGKARRRVGR
jgi:hypothetical protein